MAPDNPTDPVLADLNPAQREAVLHEAGPLLILAGAGSGKTRAITHRMAHLIQRGYAAESLLAITFTNKAAEEMKERMQRLSGVRSPWVSTFHSFCARILRRHIQRLEPYDNAFTIYDTDDARAVLKNILEELDVDRSLWTPRAAQQEISRIKNTTCGDPEAAFGADYVHGQILRNAYHLYGERLRERNAVDFDDLLLLTVTLLEEHRDVLERYQGQFRQVLIDEYQDTNAIQYRIGKLLASAHRNICITGDPDQSIYRWRGADLTNILNFERDYPDAKVVLLDRNYRSTGHILHVANALIAHNDLRKPKDLWTEKPPGEPVRVYRFVDEGEEAAEVAALIEGLLDEGVPRGDIAIFYRLNALSRALEQSLIRAGIPYSIVGGIAYFLRREVKDVLAYLRIIDNPRDEESLKRIINVPPRGIGKATVERLAASARAGHRRLLEVLLAGEWGSSTGRKTANALDSFASLYRELAEKKKGPVGDLTRQVIGSSKYEEHLKETEGDRARETIENVWQLVNAASEYDVEHPEGSLTGFLEMVNLLGDVDRWKRSEDRVALMTLHSAKGLEFPVVVIAGAEDGILPLLSAEDPEPDIEEERRLLYVGITRAMERLYVTHTASRMRFGRVRSAYPSRFLRELEPPRSRSRTESAPPSLELDRETEDSITFAGGLETRRFRRGDAPDADESSEEPIDLDGEEAYPVGSRVLHPEYGEGEVVRWSGVGRRRRVTVAFGAAGERQFVLGFTPLRRVPR